MDRFNQHNFATSSIVYLCLFQAVKGEICGYNRMATPGRPLYAISVYEKGAGTLKGKTEAIHVNMYPHSTGWANITDDGWKLIENSIRYAMGTVAVEPTGKLAVRWGDIKMQDNL